MRLGKVIGRVTLSQTIPAFEGARWLVVNPYTRDQFQGGEGYLSFSIATPTGEGVTNPRTFTRVRRCVMVDNLRIY